MFDLVAPSIPLRGEPGGPDQLMARMTLLEKPGLDEAGEETLVAFALAAWSDHWASSALDWVDQGVWSDEIAAAVAAAVENKNYSQATRHRARALATRRA